MSDRAIVTRVIWRSRLVDIAATAHEGFCTTYTLAVDGIDRITVAGGSGYPPGLTFGETHVALWTQGSIASLDLATGVTASWTGDGDGDVVAVYHRDGDWIVVAELATTVWTADLSRQLARHEHQDVVVDLAWEGNDPVLGNWTGAVARLHGSTLDRG